MKNLSLFAVLLFSTSIFAQRIINKDVGDFHTLKVFDLIEVNFIKSDENKVVIKGENVDDVKIINDNGKLKLRMDLEKRFNGQETLVEVYYTSIETLDVNEGAIIVSNEIIAQNTIVLRAQEGGKIRVGLDVNNTKIKAVTGGIIEASGISKSQEISLNTGGVFEGKELVTEDTKVAITAAGNAEINATNRVKVAITAGGDVYVYGNPTHVKKKTFAGGRVMIMN